MQGYIISTVHFMKANWISEHFSRYTWSSFCRENKLLFQACVKYVVISLWHIKSVFQFVGICVSSFFLYDDIGSLWLIWTVYIDSVFTNIDSLIYFVRWAKKTKPLYSAPGWLKLANHRSLILYKTQKVLNKQKPSDVKILHTQSKLFFINWINF